jgi:hypothetical protein
LQVKNYNLNISFANVRKKRAQNSQLFQEYRGINPGHHFRSAHISTIKRAMMLEAAVGSKKRQVSGWRQRFKGGKVKVFY